MSKKEHLQIGCWPLGKSLFIALKYSNWLFTPGSRVALFGVLGKTGACERNRYFEFLSENFANTNCVCA
jgi:hypothetical protein